MKIVLLTQNDPFYLAENLKYLVKSLPSNIEVIGVILSKPSPFGGRKSFLEKSIETLRIFGYKFFFYYSFKFFKSLFDQSKNVKKTIINLNIPIINLGKSINSPKSILIIKKYNPDLIVSILGNEIFKDKIISLPKYGIINLHSSLLPKYRGLMPCFWVLKNNETITGVSVFFVDKGIDSGPILVRKKIYIKEMSHKDLIIKTKLEGMKAIIQAIKMIEDQKINLIENIDELKTYYSFPKRDDVIKFLKEGNRFF